MSVTSGFARCDFLLSFRVADAKARAALTRLCEEEWNGARALEEGGETWELDTPLDPHALEEALAPHLAKGDRAVFYYVSSAKRLFRVVVEG